MNPVIPREDMETISEYERYMMENRNGSITAESLALMRATESRRPPGERICYDPYALRFVNPQLLEILARMPPEKIKEMQDEYEIRFPGHKNSLYTRVRFFDDKTASCIRDGYTQIVIIGAGYDTRAYRIEGISRTKVFELDLPDIQERKKATIRGIFGSLPDHVVYIQVDLSTTPLESVLRTRGFDSCRKTLFLMEGLICYIPPEKVKILFNSIISLSVPGSTVLFDSMDAGVVDGSDQSPYAVSLREQMAGLGEPFAFGIKKGDEEQYMKAIGFANVRVFTKDDYIPEYFTGIHQERQVSGLFNFILAQA